VSAGKQGKRDHSATLQGLSAYFVSCLGLHTGKCEKSVSPSPAAPAPVVTLAPALQEVRRDLSPRLAGTVPGGGGAGKTTGLLTLWPGVGPVRCESIGTETDFTLTGLY